MKIFIYFTILYFIVISSIFSFNADTLSIYTQKLEKVESKIEGVEYLKLIHSLSSSVIDVHEILETKDTLIHDTIQNIINFQEKHLKYKDKDFNKHIEFIKKFYIKYNDEDFYNFFDFINNENYNIGNKSSILFSEDKEQYLLGSLLTHYLPEFFISINISHNILEEIAVDGDNINEFKKNIYIEQNKLVYLSSSEIENIIFLLHDYSNIKTLSLKMQEIISLLETFSSYNEKDIQKSLSVIHKLLHLTEELNSENTRLLMSLLNEDKTNFNNKIQFHIYLLIFSILLVSGIFIYFFRIFNSNIAKDKELKKLNKSLVQRVEKEVADNRNKDKQLLQQSRQAQMGEMISMIAHQWRQPLAAISSTSAALEVKAILNKTDNETIIQAAQNISQYSQHLSETINDFRDFFKPTKEQKEVSFDEIIKSVMGIVEVSIENKNIKILKELNTQKKFYTYPNELKQVILNLIKNAEDILLDNEIANPYIKITTYKDENNFILEVSDNGGGIKEDIIEKVFDPYFSTKIEKNGTGLGLYMSRTIIQEHCSGRLNVSNGTDGAVFKIVLEKNEENS